MTCDPGRPPRAVRRAVGGRDGFLLAEALVTLGLAGLVLAALASVLALVLAAGERTAARAEASEVASRLAAALQRDLGGALPVRWAGKDAPFVFDGGADRLLFARDGGGTVVAVQLTVEATDAGARLLRAEAPLLPAAASPAELDLAAREAFAGTAPIAFRYAGPTVPGEPETLADTWPSGATMPTAVLVDVGGATERIAIAVDAEATCASREGPCSLRPQRDDAAEEEPADLAEDTAPL